MKENYPTTSSEDITTIMEMFGMDFFQAQSHFQASNCDLSSAIDRLLKRQKSNLEQQKIPKIPRAVQSKQSIYREESKGGVANAKIDFLGLTKLKQIKQKKIEEDMQIKLQRQRMEKSKLRQTFKYRYLTPKADIKRKKNLMYKKRQKKQNNEDEDIQEGFRSSFQARLGKPCLVEFKQQLNEAFQQLWQSKKFLAIHLLNISQLQGVRSSSVQDIQKDLISHFLRDIYLSPKFSLVFNKQFINYALDPHTFDITSYPHMIEFFSPTLDRNCLLILRLKEKDASVILADKISIFELIDPQDFQGFKRKILDRKKDYNRAIDTQICPSIHHNPLSTADRRKLNEDRNIRNAQQEQYNKMKVKMEQQHRIKRAARKQKGQQSEEQFQKLKKIVMESVALDCQRQRQQLRKKMRIYKIEQLSQPFQIKLRFPSGKQVILITPKTQVVEYAFGFVGCMPGEDLGFERDDERLFDLIQPITALSLANNKQTTFEALFEGSDGQVLIVKQL